MSGAIVECKQCKRKIYFQHNWKGRKCSCGNFIGRYFYDWEKFYQSKFQEDEYMAIELEWKEIKKIPAGEHTGQIVSVTKRDVESEKGTFEYLDIKYHLDEHDVDIIQSVPFNLSDVSKLGAMLSKFLTKDQRQGKIDIEKLLKGRKVALQTINQKAKSGDAKFARVVDGTVEPIK